jgi:hypothetical protein
MNLRRQLQNTTNFEEQVQPFLKQNCVPCHNVDNQTSQIQVNNLSLRRHPLHEGGQRDLGYGHRGVYGCTIDPIHGTIREVVIAGDGAETLECPENLA